MKLIQKNKKAYFDYAIEEDIESGIMLKGDEVKSIRNGNVSIKESFAKINRETLEAYIYDMNIDCNPFGTHVKLSPKRERKLLLHKNQIKRLLKKIEEKGLTLIPIEIYLNDRNIVKIKLALCKGKKVFDKRETIKRRDFERDSERENKIRT
ncbi:TPA: SsrA-binding protein [candidate division WOR-3 bacterium]|jgi:SsrA-binding protein|uniref:SsrA-binding protein n=1 Tax=candidate division WOR-3 bacterium TaxID=2052148 RepID=A0A350H983_UNCW3|nr:SsrA-binding protein [candidate division WOR-3 bacterium]